VTEVDPALWERPDVRAALISGDYGALLKAVRKWTGDSQSAVAGRCGLSQPDVSAIESGRRQVLTAAVQARILNGLDVPPALRPGNTAVVLPEPVLARRGVLTAAGIGLGAAALAEPFERLSHALKFPARLDGKAVDALEAAGAAHFDQEEHLPARHLMAHVAGHVDLVSLLLAGAADKHRARLAVLAGESAALAGWLAYDTGDIRSARGYWQTALDAARHATDGPLVALVLCYLSYPTGADGDHAKAARLLAEAGTHVKSSAHAAARSWIAGRQAEESAAVGDAAALVALERALTSFDYAEPDTGRPWTRFFDNARLGSLAVSTYARLGHAGLDDAAGAVLESVSSRKTRAVILGDVAGGYMTRGDVESACELAEQALEATLTSEAVLGRDRLTALRPALDASGSTTAAELSERIGASFA
jgi:transcriptional regulator with XRE-family HTH domain